MGQSASSEGAQIKTNTSAQEKQKPLKPLKLRKLSFKEERELESLPLKIEKLGSRTGRDFCLAGGY